MGLEQGRQTMGWSGAYGDVDLEKEIRHNIQVTGIGSEQGWHQHRAKGEVPDMKTELEGPGIVWKGGGGLFVQSRGNTDIGQEKERP